MSATESGSQVVLSLSFNVQDAEKDGKAERKEGKEEEEGKEEDVKKMNYWETLMHIHKSNTGSGMFAMGDAFKNAGLLLGPAMVMFLGCVCVHCQHMMLNVCEQTSKRLKNPRSLDFEEASALCFEHGHPRGRRWAQHFGRVVSVFICITQSGFCCVYIVFISTNIKQVWDAHLHPHIPLSAMMAIVLVPMILLSWIRDLKSLAPVSTLANILVTVGVVIVLSVAAQDLPDISERRIVTENLAGLPLFFGTILYTFEGIGLVTPIKKRYRHQERFGAPLGPLNVAMTVLALLVILLGFLGYWRWGDDVQGSLTLNLDQDSALAQSMKTLISLGVLLTYPLQLNPAVSITFAALTRRFGPFKRSLLVSLCWRTLYTIFLFTLAEVVPHLALFISLVGAVSSTALALIIPPFMDLATFHDDYGRLHWRIWKNVFIVLLGVCGFVTGTFYSLKDIVHTFQYNGAPR